MSRVAGEHRDVDCILDRSCVAVVGGGPAGVTAARALAALGHHVVLVARPRRFGAVEGVSERAAEALRLAGCEEALGVLGPALPRVSSWNGGSTPSGAEHLVDRARFDEALYRDAARAGVAYVEGHCDGWQESERGCRLFIRPKSARTFASEVAFAVDARGRASSSDRASSVRGAATTALSGSWTAPRAPRGSALASFPRGWCWLANPEDDTAFLQLFVSSERNDTPWRDRLDTAYEALLGEIHEARGWLEGATRCSALRARDATPILPGGAVSPRSLRVGDAAFAVDPLSGQGTFEAVATALAAAPVVNTLLRRASDRALAQEFYRERIEETFLRLARAGRDAYRAEQRWRDQPFWRERRSWPDDEPARRAGGPATIRSVAVSEEGYIVSRRAIVTPDHPRGVWRLDSVELVPLLEFAAAHPSDRDEDLVTGYAERSATPRESIARALEWLRRRELVETATPRATKP
jgi:flavin-dependent dehydrogenase